MNTAHATQPWLSQLHEQLDALERALLQGDAPQAERASAGVQAVLQQAPRGPQRPEAAALQAAAQRFAQLRSATLRAAAGNLRALGSLMRIALLGETGNVAAAARLDTLFGKLLTDLRLLQYLVEGRERQPVRESLCCDIVYRNA